jgi:hypothetical protein
MTVFVWFAYRLSELNHVPGIDAPGKSPNFASAVQGIKAPSKG